MVVKKCQKWNID